MRFSINFRLVCGLECAEGHLQPRHKYSWCIALAPPRFNLIPKFETLDSAALCRLQISNPNTNLPGCAAHREPCNYSDKLHNPLLRSNSPAGTIMLLASKHENKNCALLGHYAASSGNFFFLPKFRDNLSGPSSEFKNPPPQKK